MIVTTTPFGQLADGESVHLISLENDNGVSLNVCTYGAAITSIKVPDRDGRMGETVLGFDSLDSYLKDHPFIGTIVGRVANRISKAQFNLNGEHYQLNSNNGPHHLHGGTNGFHRQNWQHLVFKNEKDIGVILEHMSPDGSENYPGQLSCHTVISLDNDNSINLEYFCRSNQDTIVNLTHHEYFNLKDGGMTTALNHELKIFASQYTPVNEYVCPTGQIAHTQDSLFDFSSFKNIGEMIKLKDGGINPGQGFDNNFVCDNKTKLKHMAIVRENTTGRQLDIYSTKECVQFYTGGHLEGQFGSGKKQFNAYHGFCLEPQSFPDAINHAGFPSIVLKAGNLYNHKTVYRYSTF